VVSAPPSQSSRLSLGGGPGFNPQISQYWCGYFWLLYLGTVTFFAHGCGLVWTLGWVADEMSVIKK
jgi:hypothetical protein